MVQIITFKLVILQDIQMHATKKYKLLVRSILIKSQSIWGLVILLFKIVQNHSLFLCPNVVLLIILS